MRIVSHHRMLGFAGATLFALGLWTLLLLLALR